MGLPAVPRRPGPLPAAGRRGGRRRHGAAQPRRAFAPGRHGRRAGGGVRPPRRLVPGPVRAPRRRWWNAYPDRGLGARTATVLGSLAVGVAVGVLVRAAPLVSAAAGIAQDATAAGVRATARTLLDRVGGAIGLT